jgi:pimeloyl-ACP methyl ester carboxylesterase
MMSMLPGSFRSAAETVRVPLFLAAGANDIGVPPARALQDFPAVDDATLLILPGTGHNHFGFSTMAQLCARLGHWAISIVKDQA